MTLKLPPHAASLILIHNDHKNSYLTVARAIERGEHGYADKCWVSPEQMQKAIETNDCWTLQWHPDTPIGFHMLSAADLDILLEAANAKVKA